MTDGDLLQKYLNAGSEGAFTELVRRHLDLVYSAALRKLGGDETLAKDVAQSLFLDLARKASSLTGRVSLAGWLYTSARFAATSTVRSEQRRRLREEEAARMQENREASTGNLNAEQLDSALDDAMDELDDSDREAILLRFFQARDLKAVGTAFGISDDAARKRVDRAVEKLREKFVRRGIESTGMAMSTVLASE
jgi:RNA polymerase sigma factor (sigma-70 family)